MFPTRAGRATGVYIMRVVMRCADGQRDVYVDGPCVDAVILMYDKDTHMSDLSEMTPIISRGLSLHKLIR